MCTLSYVPHPTKDTLFTVTSNRDESVNRPAENPMRYKELNSQLYYPKDKKAGGTWIGVGKRKRLMALLNGAFQKYDIHKKYRKSRGVVLKELLASKDIFQTIKEYNFEGIAPFFSLLFSWESQWQLYEIIWDGKKLYRNKKDERYPAIWSSMMSYSPEQHAKKEKLFEDLLEKNRELSSDLLWQFHHLKGNKEEEGILINRGTFQTTSISQFQHTEDKADTFRFSDLMTNKQQIENIIWTE